MNLVILKKARKQLEKLPKLKQIIIGQKVRAVGLGEQGTNIKLLSGYKDVYRARVGDYRIIYKMTADEVTVIMVAHRGEVYRLLEQLLK